MVFEKLWYIYYRRVKIMGKKLKYLDKTLLFTTVLLFIIGLVFVFSSSNVTAYMSKGVSPYYYFIRQAEFLGVGLIMSLLMVSLNTKVYGKISYLLMIGTIVALFALLLYGSATNHAISWFQIGAFKIQPSEFIKVITIVFLADYYDANRGKLTGWLKCLLPIGLCIIVVGLICAQPDLGTAFIYSAIVGAIFIAVPMAKEIKYKVVFVAFVVVILGLFTIFSFGKTVLLESKIERFDYKNPCDKILENGSQVCNCYIAINNGGLLGVGLGNSTQKYLYLPEPYTDFIYAIIVEEAGIAMGIFIIILYMIVLWRILKIGRNSPSNRGALLCYGTAIYIFLHIAINLLGIMGVIPLTGVPLPFMSYGGSFTICLIAALTMVQRVSVDNGLLKEKGD